MTLGDRTHVAAADRPWSATVRILFRLCFVYFSLYCAATQVLGGTLRVPGHAFPSLGTMWPMRSVTLWLGERVLHVRSPLVYTGNSGDTAFYWIQTAWLATLALIITAAWTDIDRQRTKYVTLHKWLRLVLRFCLAAQMFEYGLAKVIPTQFPAPSLVTLLEPVGHLSLTDMLWVSIGASTPYQMFTGAAEMLAGVLLIVPRTALLGALIALVDMLQVFALNVAYDFGLKQISLHLILIALFLIAPDAQRLFDFFLTDRRADPAHDRPLFRTMRANRIALLVQLIAGVYLIALFAEISASYWYGPGGGGSAKSPLYGIWEVSELSVDGEVRPVGVNDYDRQWRRVIFDAPDVVVFERLDDSFAHYGATIDPAARSIVLTKNHRSTWQAHFTFERPSADRLILDGEMDEMRIHVRLQLVDFDSFRLLNSGFRWIRPPD